MLINVLKVTRGDYPQVLASKYIDPRKIEVDSVTLLRYQWRMFNPCA